jgi:MSHA biogenesis protein MshJ
MKRKLQLVEKRIDAMSLRERGLLFCAVVAVLGFLFNLLFWDPLVTEQKKLELRMREDQQKTAEIEVQIQQKVAAIRNDPDASAKKRLAELQQKLQQTRLAMSEMQKGLVPPDKMAEVLEGILKRQENLHLVSLRSTTPEILNQPLPDMKPLASASGNTASLPMKGTPDPKGNVGGVVYKHGVELVLQGGYGDIVNYLQALETMPWQFFWGRAVVSAEAYPKATVTLTLYTLAREDKWMNL